MSPILFIIYADIILVVLSSKRIGVFFRGVYTGASMFADDLSLLMNSLEELERALAILQTHSLISRTTYNTAKTRILIFGETPLYYAQTALWPHLIPRFHMGSSEITPVSVFKLLGVRSDDRLSFRDQLHHILTTCHTQAADLRRAGVVRDGLNIRTAIGMWKAIYVPYFSYCIQIWYNDTMAPSLDPILTEPLLLSLASPSSVFPSHTPILNLELRLPSISHIFRQSLLLHEHRLQTKPTSNPAAQLNRTLVSNNHPSQRLVNDTLTLLHLSRDDLHHPDYQTILLNANITVTRQEESDKLIDYVGRSYLKLLSPHDTNYPPFYKSFPHARHVLILRLQLAPLATMTTNRHNADCERCADQTPDTLDHWLLSCTSLNTPRAAFLRNLAVCADALDDTISNLSGNPTTQVWASAPHSQKLLFLQGSTPDYFHNALTQPFKPQATPFHANPDYLTAPQIHQRFVACLQTFCEAAFKLPL